MDLGGGHEIEFVMAPNLHWPDTMFTFDHATGKPFKVDRITVLLLQIQRRCVSVLSHGNFLLPGHHTEHVWTMRAIVLELVSLR